MLLLAAGRGRRFGGDQPKVWLDCAGRSVLRRSVERLAAVSQEGEIVLAVHPDDREGLLDHELERLQAAGLTQVVDGGDTRQASMRHALAASDPSFPLVLVHDAARPFPPISATREALARAGELGAACLAVPAPDTLKRVDGDQRIVETVDRRGIWLAQTPQVAKRELLERALDAAEREGFSATDDVSLLERAGVSVEVVRGSSTNLKITTAEDLELAVRIAQMEDEGS